MDEWTPAICGRRASLARVLPAGTEEPGDGLGLVLAAAQAALVAAAVLGIGPVPAVVDSQQAEQRSSGRGCHGSLLGGDRADRAEGGSQCPRVCQHVSRMSSL